MRRTTWRTALAGCGLPKTWLGPHWQSDDHARAKALGDDGCDRLQGYRINLTCVREKRL
jgi:hypothetical protein